MAALLVLSFAACGDDGGGGGNESGDETSVPTEEAGDTSDDETSEPGADNYGYPADVPLKNKDGKLQPPPVQIGGGVNSGKEVDSDTIVVIRSQKQLDKLEKDLSKGQKQDVMLTSTDFDSRMMIAVLLKPNKDGAQAQVTYVRAGDDGFIVSAVRLLAGSGCEGDGKKSNAYSVVETDRLKGSATLKVKTERQPACR